MITHEWYVIPLLGYRNKFKVVEIVRGKEQNFPGPFTLDTINPFLAERRKQYGI